MRKKIIELGGEFYFNEKVTDFEFENNKVKGFTLPVDDKGNIDYAYMSAYMKALEISSATKIKQLNFA